jgi:hypothetical protein
VCVCVFILPFIERQSLGRDESLLDVPFWCSLIGLHSASRLAVQVQVLLAIDRVDLAENVAKQMQRVDDDDCLSQMATAWVNLSKRTPQGALEANSAFSELLEKFGASVKVLNSLAACQLALKNPQAAFAFLKKARDLAQAQGEKISAEASQRDAAQREERRAEQSKAIQTRISAAFVSVCLHLLRLSLFFIFGLWSHAGLGAWGARTHASTHARTHVRAHARRW